MGKNRIIKILGRLIAGMAAHKILEKYTNKKESLNHLRQEVDNYRGNISNFISEYNWNENDKKRVKNEALRILILELKKEHFSDVSFPGEEVNIILENVLKEMFED